MVIPEGITEIKNYTFFGGVNFKSVSIPSSVESVGIKSFGACKSLLEIDIPSGINKIGYLAFSDCEKLERVAFNGCIKSIENDAFSGCNGLKGVYISDLVSWCNTGFENGNSNPLYNAQNLYLNGEVITDLVIPDGITEIKNYTFFGGVNFKSVSIPSGVESVGYATFAGCNSIAYNEYGNAKYLGNESNPYFVLIEATDNDITSCEINDGTKVIASNAFRECRKLEKIEIPACMEPLKNNVFEFCSSLIKVTYDGTKEQWKNFITDKFGYIDSENTKKYVREGCTVYCTDGYFSEKNNL